MKNLSILMITICLCFTFEAESQTFKYPTAENGSKVVCEKFEQLEHFIKRENSLRNKGKKGGQQIGKRSDGEVLVNSNKNEFELHAAVNPQNENNIVVGCIQFQPQSMTQPLSIGIYTTMDGAETWTRSNFDGIIEGGILPIGGGDPIVVFDNDGVAHLTWLMVMFGSPGTWGIYYAASVDGGLNWETKVPIIETSFTDLFTLSDLEFAADKQWMVADNSLNSPYEGNVYTAFVNIKNLTSVPLYEITFQRKESNQDAFDNENAIVLNTENYSIAQFTSIDTDKEGNIYVTFLAEDNTESLDYAIYMSKSIDGGVSFSPEQKVQDLKFAQLTNAGNEIVGVGAQRLYPSPHIAVDKSGGEFDGRLYVTYTSTKAPNSILDGYDIYITTSDDKGDTWSTPRVVNNDDNPLTEQFYSAIDISEEGYVSLSWYDGRDAVDNTNNINYYLGVSKDGGETFEQSRMSSVASDFSQIGVLNDGFGVGEYNQVVSTKDYIIPFWADGRNNNGEISIYGYKQDKNTIVSTADGLVKLNSDVFITSLSPNPAYNHISVEVSLAKAKTISYEVVDMTGKQVILSETRKYQEGRSEFELNVQGLASGQYILIVKTDKDQISRKINVIKR